MSNPTLSSEPPKPWQLKPEEVEAAMTYYKTKRANAKREITNTSKKISGLLKKTALEEADINALTRQMAKLKTAEANLKSIHEEMLTLCSTDEEQQEIFAYGDEIDHEIDHLAGVVDAALAKPTTSALKNPTSFRHVPDHDDDDDEDAGSSISTSSRTMEPLLLFLTATFDITKECPSFDGTRRDKFDSWLVQWEQAEKKMDLIGKTPGEKLLALKKCLKGRALSYIESMKDGPNANYDGAKKILINYYQDGNISAKASIDALLNIQVSTDKADSIEQVLFKLNSIWESLQGLNVTGDQAFTLLFCAIAETKLSPRLRRSWARKMADKRDPTHPVGHTANQTDLFKVLQDEIQMLHSIAGNQKSTTNEDNKQKPKEEVPKTDQKKKDNKSLPSSFATTTQTKSRIPCSFCGQTGHWPLKCSVIKEKSVRDRIELVRKKNLCFLCFTSLHKTKECKLKPCDIDGCNQPHSRMLHIPKTSGTAASTAAPTQAKQQTQTSPPKEVASNHSVACGTASKPSQERVSILKSCLAWAVSPTGEKFQARVFLDQGAEMNLITRKMAEIMGLNGDSCTLQLSVTGGQTTDETKEKKVTLDLQSLDGKYRSRRFSACTVDTITAPLKRIPFKPEEYPHLKNLIFTENYPREEAPVDILLGGVICDDLITGPVIRGKTQEEPTALPTKLGYILTGSLPRQKSPVFHFASYKCSIKSLEQQMDSFLSLEGVGIQPLSAKTEQRTFEEEMAVDMAEKTTYYNASERRWHTSLPFKASTEALQDNYAAARAVLLKGERTAIATGKVEALNAAYQDLIDNNFCEPVPDSELIMPCGTTHYLQCHPVYREDKSTFRCRVVMNASAKQKGFASLNNLLYQGPSLLRDFVQILLRFRLHFHAVILDISRMFLNVRLDQGKDYLRFLWRNCQQSEPIKVWRMSVVAFGLVCSPFLACFVLQKHAELFRSKFPLAVKPIQNDTYMDDSSYGASTVSQAKEITHQLIQLLAEASFKAHKLASNSAEVLNDVAEDLKCSDTVVKVLGVAWNTLSDQLTFDFIGKLTDGPATKRTVLQESSRVFDPTGLLQPFTIRMKLLLQEIWLSKLPWDEPLPAALEEKWSEWKKEVPTLTSLTMARCFFDKQKGQPTNVSLFGFGDASQLAFATAIYLVATYQDSSKTSKLVFAKARVAPLPMLNAKKSETETIARLELLAAVVTARALTYVKEALSQQIKIDGTFCLTDSMITLHRIRNGPDRFKVWIGSRINEIISLTEKTDWFFVPGVINPADLPSRGLNAADLLSSELWWCGPPFIRQEQALWPREPPVQVQDLEQKPEPDIAMASHSTTQNHDFFMDLFNKHSDWHSTVRLFAYIFRLGHPRSKEFRKQPISRRELQEAEDFIWKKCQQIGMSDEISTLKKGLDLPKNSKLNGFNPVWDEERGFLISHSRLAQSDLPTATKFPVILPKNCPIVAKYVMSLHQQNYHAGPEHVLSLLRRRFQLQQGRRQVKKIVRTCLNKLCQRPRLLTQQMAPLPSLRTDQPGAFRNVAVDLFGPMIAKHQCSHPSCPHPKTQKVYGALYTCMHSRAVHVELVLDQGTEEFLNSFRCFVARRGTPSTVFSDHGKNFSRGSKELKKLFKSINWKKVQDQGNSTQIDWIFNVEKAPWANGVAERMVKSVKQAIRAAIGSALLTSRQIQIIFSECEMCVNNRPLGTISDHPDDLLPITPAELIIGRRMESIPDPNPRKKIDSDLLHIWTLRKRVLNSFWSRWKKDYLLAQNVRKKWHRPTHQDLLNRIVMIAEDNLSRGEWRLGKVIDVIKSKDGLIRAAMVKTATSTLRRPIQKLALLENVF